MERNSFLIVAKALLTDKRISATAKLLLAQLEDHRNPETGQCNPSRKKLTKELGLPLHAVKRALIELRKFGFIRSKQARYTNNYEIQVAQIRPPKPPGGANKATQVAQLAPPGLAGPLYETYPGEERPRAEARSRRSPQNTNPDTCPTRRPDIPRKSAGLETVFDPLNGKFLSTAQMQQVGWALMDQAYEEYAQKEREKERRKVGGK
jgi:hypothetical protein